MRQCRASEHRRTSSSRLLTGTVHVVDYSDVDARPANWSVLFQFRLGSSTGDVVAKSLHADVAYRRLRNLFGVVVLRDARGTIPSWSRSGRSVRVPVARHVASLLETWFIGEVRACTVASGDP